MRQEVGVWAGSTMAVSRQGTISSMHFGSMFCFTYNYTKNFNLYYPYLQEDAAMLHIDKLRKGFGCSFSLGVNAKVLGYSYVLDEAKSQGYQLDAKVLSATLYGGMNLLYDRHRPLISKSRMNWRRLEVLAISIKAEMSKA